MTFAVVIAKVIGVMQGDCFVLGYSALLLVVLLNPDQV